MRWVCSSPYRWKTSATSSSKLACGASDGGGVTGTDSGSGHHPGHGRDPVALSRGQHAELVAVGIGHDHPADLALADVDAGRPEGDETVDLRSLITVDGWSDVEMQAVLPRLRCHRRTAPGDLRTAVRRADR